MLEVSRSSPREIELRAALEDSGIPVYSEGLGYDFLDPVTGIFSNEPMPIVTLWGESEMPTKEEVEEISRVGREIAQRRFHSTEQEGIFAQGATMGILYKRGENAWSFRRVSWTEGSLWTEPSPLKETFRII